MRFLLTCHGRSVPERSSPFLYACTMSYSVTHDLSDLLVVLMLRSQPASCFFSVPTVNLDLLAVDVREMSQGVKLAAGELVHNKNNKRLKVKGWGC